MITPKEPVYNIHPTFEVFMIPKKKKVRKKTGKRYRLVGGPYGGMGSLFLSSDTTMIFSVGSNRGYYAQGYWVDMPKD